MHSIYGKEVEGVEHKDAKLALNFIIPQIDNMIKAYDEKVERGSKGGRPKKIDDDEVYKLALQGMKGPTIAKELGCGKSSIYDNAGWKRAQKELFRKPEIFPVRKLKEFSE
jgi:DNA invertase Pin-like site-specific DNA recombinase